MTNKRDEKKAAMITPSERVAAAQRAAENDRIAAVRASLTGEIEKLRDQVIDIGQECQARTIERDGWKQLAEAMFSAAFGNELRGFGNVPPTELLDAIKGHGDGDLLAALRDGLLGRAWRVSRSGHCDYPLCPNRDATPRPQLITQGLGVNGRTVRVCITGLKPDAQPVLGECRAWAAWVRERALAGRIEVR